MKWIKRWMPFFGAGLLLGCGASISSNTKEINLVDQPLGGLDRVIASMMTTSNGEVVLKLGDIGKDKNYCSFHLVEGGVTMRFPASDTSRWNRRQGAYVPRLKEVAASLSLPLEEIPIPDRDGSVRGITYVFLVSGEPGTVAPLIKKLLTETFDIAETDRCNVQYQNMPATWVSRPGDEPTLVSADDVQEAYALGTRAYLGESNGKVYFRPGTMPMRSQMRWNKEIWYTDGNDLPLAFLDQLRQDSAKLAPSPPADPAEASPGVRP